MRNCKKYEELMWLSLYDELKADERQSLEDHLKICSQCQVNFQQLQHSFKLIDQKIQFEPTESALQSFRGDLHQQLLFLRHKNHYEFSFWSKLWKVLSLDFSPRVRFTTVFAVMFFGVFLGGLAMHYQINKIIPSGQFKPPIFDRAELIRYDPVSKQALIKFNAVTEQTVTGSLEQPEIQRLLAQSLMKDDRVNFRLKTMQTISAIKNYHEPLIQALIEVLLNDENSGIRLKTAKLLNTLPMTDETKEQLIAAYSQVLLTEKNSAIRNEAIDGLTRINDFDSHQLVIDVAKKDSNQYLKYKANQLSNRIKLERD
jgi:hypothetical protein